MICWRVDNDKAIKLGKHAPAGTKMRQFCFLLFDMIIFKTSCSILMLIFPHNTAGSSCKQHLLLIFLIRPHSECCISIMTALFLFYAPLLWVFQRFFPPVYSRQPALCVVNKPADGLQRWGERKNPTFLVGGRNTPTFKQFDLDTNRFLDMCKYHNADLFNKSLR